MNNLSNREYKLLMILLKKLSEIGNDTVKRLAISLSKTLTDSELWITDRKDTIAF